MRIASILILVLVGANAGRAQVVITAEDMFNQVGQYYRAYVNADDVSLAGQLGAAGGPQSWDFTGGPMDEVHRVDIVVPEDGGHGADFPQAKFAERTTVEATAHQSWIYREQVPGIGRMVYGFYDTEFSDTKPSHPFTASIVDFPDTIRFGDSWNTSTSFRTEKSFSTGGDPEDPEGGTFVWELNLKRTSTSTVDAFGIVNLPGVGFGEALRVNELVTYVIEADLQGDGNFQPISTQYVRNYYWLREDHGIAVQITSKQENAPPPDDFPVAAKFVRMFETNHPVGQSTAEVIRDFKVTLGKDRALLSWSKLGSVGSYRVEYTDDLSTGTWIELGTTTSNFMVDTSVTGTTQRFYRLTGQKN